MKAVDFLHVVRTLPSPRFAGLAMWAPLEGQIFREGPLWGSTCWFGGWVGLTDSRLLVLLAADYAAAQPLLSMCRFP